MSSQLKQRWEDFGTSHNADIEKVREVWLDLERQHSIPGRDYHNLDHIGYSLTVLDDAYRNFRNRPPGLESQLRRVIAVLYCHDYFCDPRRKDNVIRSAAVAVRFSRRLFGPDVLALPIIMLTIATDHDLILTDPVEQFIADIDLASFAKRWEEYLADVWKLRRETSWMTDREFMLDRLKWLEKLSARKFIYYLPYFRDKYEWQAMSNIARELGLLRRITARFK
ncbi:MAG TPA: hypothetical protein VG102_01265 [Candidatus Paceibacterota bacterium]|jgi:predicted metal-dependent HD superfamily phosphohydrolase|nr:hypothetical protein [Candidatus Paceibacterota bacterium]